MSDTKQSATDRAREICRSARLMSVHHQQWQVAEEAIAATLAEIDADCQRRLLKLMADRDTECNLLRSQRNTLREQLADAKAESENRRVMLLEKIVFPDDEACSSCAELQSQLTEKSAECERLKELLGNSE